MTTIAAPLTERQAALIEPIDLLADDPPGLRRAWDRTGTVWAATIDAVRPLPPDVLDARVGDGWSLLQHLRHLVFVADAWIGDIVLDLPAPYDPIGLPPHFVTDGARRGIDPDAQPPLADVVAARARSRARVDGVLAALDAGGLARPCRQFDGKFTVLGALQVVIFEEWAHHRYTTRDLSALGHPGATGAGW